MKNILFSILLLGWWGLSFAQTIQKVEYFIDTDPGFGSGINVPITGGSTVTANLSIPLPSSIISGFHKVYIRAKNSNGVWSIVNTQSFFKTNDLPTIQNIVKLEYFIDSDAGFGQGINIPITTNATVNQGLNISMPSNLTSGFHSFFIRAKDFSGKWSTVFSQSFFKTNNLPTIQNIVKLEYFIDSDAGFGQGIDIPISPNTTVNQGFNIPLPSNLPNGFHKFFIRAKDASGKWSTLFFQNFFKTHDLPTLQNIVKLEYFIDTDPGVGLGTSIVLVPNTGIELNSIVFNIGSVPLGGGEHTIHFRAQDANGKWSIVANKKFTECNYGATLSGIPNPFSCGDPLTITTAFQSNGHTLSWDWYKDGTYLGFANQTQIQVVESGRYSLLIKDPLISGSCSSMPSNLLDVSILKNENIEIESVGNVAGCDEPILLKIKESSSQYSTELGINYQWFKNNVAVPNSNFSQISVLIGGDYKLQISQGGGLSSCSVITSNSLQILDKKYFVELSPVNDLPNNIIICQGSEIDLSHITNLNSTGLNFQWFKDDLEISNTNNGSLHVNNQPGVYKLRVMSPSCNPLFSATYQLTYSNVPSTPISISLTSGVLNSCPGETANLTLTGCASDILWNNSITINPLLVTQQNQTETYVASCLGTCISQSNEITFSPTAPTYPAPLIKAQPTPVSSTYTLAPQSVYITGMTGKLINGTAWRYPDFNAPIKIIPTASGRNYFISNTFIFNAIDKNEQPVYSGEGIFTSIPGTDVYSGGTSAATDLTLLQSGDFLISGYTNQGIVGDKTTASFGNTDFWIFTRDILGVKGFEKSYGGNGTDKLAKSIQLPDGNMMLCGTSSSVASGNKASAAIGDKDYWVVKTDAVGNRLTDFSFGGTLSDELIDAVLLSDGNILLAGNSLSGITGNKTTASTGCWLVKIDQNGAIVWQYLHSNSSILVRSLTEINNKIYLSTNQGIQIINADGSAGVYKEFTFNLESHATDLPNKFYPYSTLVTPDKNILVYGKIGGQANMGNTQYSYDAILFFEVDDNLNIISNFPTFGSYGNSDSPGPPFFDSRGFLHIIKANGTLSCVQDPNIFVLDYNPNFKTGCNNEDQNRAIWSQWVMNKYNLKEQEYRDFCIGKEFLVHAEVPLTTVTTQLRNVKFTWSDGVEGQTRKVTPQTQLPLSVRYEVANELTCGSLVSSINLIPYGNKLILQGINQTDISKKFAYEQLISTENNEVSRRYSSLGSISLKPGFQISAAAQKVFEAKIEGCVNN